MTTTVLERTIELVPELRERAEQANADRRLPEENIKALRQAGSFKVLQSSRNGGLGLGVRDHLDVISTLARGCASTAWVAGVVHAHSWLLSHFPAEGQDDVYGADPDAVVSAVIGPRGHAVQDRRRVPAGGRVAVRVGLRARRLVAARGGRGRRRPRKRTIVDEGDFIVPTSAVTFFDDWYVTGLRATGSCTVKVDGLDIPAHRFLSMPGLIMGNSPGGRLHSDWVQQCAPVPVLTIALTGGALGLARQALEDFPPARHRQDDRLHGRAPGHPPDHAHQGGGCGDARRGG